MCGPKSCMAEKEEEYTYERRNGITCIEDVENDLPIECLERRREYMNRRQRAIPMGHEVPAAIPVTAEPAVLISDDEDQSSATKDEDGNPINESESASESEEIKETQNPENEEEAQQENMDLEDLEINRFNNDAKPIKYDELCQNYKVLMHFDRQTCFVLNLKTGKLELRSIYGDFFHRKEDYVNLLDSHGATHYQYDRADPLKDFVNDCKRLKECFREVVLTKENNFKAWEDFSEGICKVRATCALPGGLLVRGGDSDTEYGSEIIWYVTGDLTKLGGDWETLGADIWGWFNILIHREIVEKAADLIRPYLEKINEEADENPSVTKDEATEHGSGSDSASEPAEQKIQASQVDNLVKKPVETKMTAEEKDSMNKFFRGRVDHTVDDVDDCNMRDFRIFTTIQWDNNYTYCHGLSLGQLQLIRIDNDKYASLKERDDVYLDDEVVYKKSQWKQFTKDYYLVDAHLYEKEQIITEDELNRFLKCYVHKIYAFYAHTNTCGEYSGTVLVRGETHGKPMIWSFDKSCFPTPKITAHQIVENVRKHNSNNSRTQNIPITEEASKDKFWSNYRTVVSEWSPKSKAHDGIVNDRRRLASPTICTSTQDLQAIGDSSSTATVTASATALFSGVLLFGYLFSRCLRKTRRSQMKSEIPRYD